MTEGVTDRQREILRHALGLNGSRRTPYRRHFAAEPEGDDYQDLVALEAAGLVVRGKTSTQTLAARLYGSLVFFYVTARGAAAVGSRLPE